MTVSGIRTDFTNMLANAQEGMQRSMEQVNAASESIANGDLDPGNMIDLMVGQRTYAMNAKLVKTADQMMGTLLDVLR
jgi:flagellar basal body rod protein FlgG